MQVPQENIFAHKNIKHEQVQEVYKHVTNTIFVRTKPLKQHTGIYSLINPYDKGFEWFRLRDNAIKEGASLDYAIIDLTA